MPDADQTNLEEPPAAAHENPQAAAKPARQDRTHVLHRLPVTVSVRLAEKKIEMGGLLGLTPGALISFDKSCEDLLDLYVNNRLYCRGEAVKIGEKFGLKINQVGVKPIEKPRVLG